MKATVTRYIKRTIHITKKRMDFSVINVQAILFIAGVILISVFTNIFMQDKLKNNNELSIEQTVHHEFTYIKPFTSLVGFNLKFNKENKRRSKASKVVSLSVNLFNLKPF